MTAPTSHAPQPARPSVRGQVQLDLFTVDVDGDSDTDSLTDGDMADAIAAVEPYLPRDDGTGHDEQ